MSSLPLVVKYLITFFISMVPIIELRGAIPIAESLNLLKTSIDTNTTEFRQHDERSIKEFGKINEHFIKIEEHIK